MILKIKRNWGTQDNPAPEVVIECQRYDWRGSDELDKKMENCESMFGDSDGEVNPTIFLTPHLSMEDVGRITEYFLIGNAIVYVMNNEGKTVDTIYA